MTQLGQDPIDLWSPLDRKTINMVGNLRLAPTWVPSHEVRRLNAYGIRHAYRANQAYRYLPGGPATDRNAQHREYGDPALYEDRMVAAIRGDTQTITVDGADDALLAGPTLPERPVNPGDQAEPLDRAIHDARLKAWTVEAETAVEAWQAALDAQPDARRRQQALRTWADRVLLPLALDEAEHDTVGLGDSVVVLWPRPGDWPTVQVYDPGMYFPEIPANGDQVDYPDTVHLAWEYEDTDLDGTRRRFVRRLTWQLVDIAATKIADGLDGQPVWVGPDGQPLEPDQPLVLPSTERLLADGHIERANPWGDTTTRTCLFTDATWRLEDVQAGKRDALAWGNAAEVNVDRLDLGIDFIPVIHRPHTPTGREHYGRSLFDLAVRLFDDLARIDTLTMNAGQYLGHPTIGAAGVDPGTDAVVMPGRILKLGDNGRLDVLDLSSGIEQLMGLNERLRDRLGVNLGIGELTGRTGSTSSGVHLLLKLAPAITVVGNARMVREPKDSLLLKFAQRMAQVAGALEKGATPTARLRYGSFLPIDQAQTATAVAELLRAHAISTQTAVAMLVAAGLPITDAQAEVDRIRAEDTEGAKNVADALNSEQAAADYLGIDLPTATAPPTITLPPAGA